MDKKLVVNVTDHETRVALLEDGTIAELFIERRDDLDIAGNIYKGKVQRVLPGMQAAFVDIGLRQAAFIYVDDVLCNDYKEFEQLFDNNNVDAENGDDDRSVPRTIVTRRDCPIEEILIEGQEIMVQVAKAPIGTKGARITSYTSLPGRYLVLMPNSDHIGISRRIEDENERNRLKNLVLSLRADNFGYIVRTVAEGIQKEKLANEMGFFKNLWEKIQAKYQTAPAPSLLHQELAITLRAIRDLFTHEAEKLIVDSRSGYESVLSFLDGFMPNLKDSVDLYAGAEPIFDAYNLEGDISRALKRKVWLKSGGYIVIEQTEALWPLMSIRGAMSAGTIRMKPF